MAQMTKEELLERLNGCETVEDVQALGHDLGKDISDEEAQQVIDALEAQEEDLTEEELENMNGGTLSWLFVVVVLAPLVILDTAHG